MATANFLPPQESKIVVGISGGVDSAVTALLLKQQGYQVTGVFMQNWEDTDESGCTVRQDYADAMGVCQQIGIELHHVNFAREYWDEVFSDFLEQYKAGFTPNPDILCNKYIKFKHFIDYASKLGAEYIATGHYAQLTHSSDRVSLLKGVDANKDQSYFLHAVSSVALVKSVFPLGGLEKTQVRAIAKQHNLVNYSKKDSTGICFIGERKFKDFLSQYIKEQPGKIVSLDGQVMGKHDGLMFHTLGQRQGLGIGGSKLAGNEPWYVAHKDLENNNLVVVQGGEHTCLFTSELTTEQISWINPIDKFPLECSAKVRYRQVDQECVVDKLAQGYKVCFKQPQRAVTLGQSIVFYQGDICLGGGIIEQVKNDFFS
jgi:tRNA-uridine 2-sulfurtransferase